MKVHPGHCQPTCHRGAVSGGVGRQGQARLGSTCGAYWWGLRHSIGLCSSKFLGRPGLGRDPLQGAPWLQCEVLEAQICGEGGIQIVLCAHSLSWPI